MTLDRYKILAPLGAGGMGEVYRAHDSRLGRDVALKVIPFELSHDAGLTKRFEQEARAAGALAHPNVVAIHDVGTHDGSPFVVMELLQGQTLREKLSQGPVPVHKAVDYAAQVARGLAAAHAKGIVHRDLKPENLFVTTDGQVKVLDFGLAKLTRSEVLASGEQRVSIAPTETGVILGTAGYMAPEQARGKSADQRSDLFALGAILYEMVSGRRAFQGASFVETLHAILNEEPPALLASGRELPPGLEQIVRHCLEKNPEERFQSARDLAFHLEALSRATFDTGPGAAQALSSPKPQPGFRSVADALRKRRALVATVAIGSALLVGLGAWLALRASLAARGRAPALRSVAQLSHDPGITEWPTWSTDGSLLAFASSRDGDFEIYVRRVEGGQEVNITGDDAQDYQPAFSPNGNSVAFVSTRSSRSGMIRIGSSLGFEFRTFGGDIWVAPALGGRARRLAPDGNFPVWHPDGKRVAYVGGTEQHRSILEVAAEGGSPRTLLGSDASGWEIIRIQYSPTGRWLTFETFDGETFLIPASGGAPRLLLKASSVVWEGSGKRVYFLQRDPSGGTRLQSAMIDEATGRVRGVPQTVGLMTGILRDLAVSHDGQQLAASELEGSLNLTRQRLTPDGASAAGPEEELSKGRMIDRYPSFSPDGRRIVFASNRLGSLETWILDLETRRSERLELPGEDLGTNISTFSPDGKHLAVTRLFPDGTRSVWIAAIDGSGAEELVPPASRLQGWSFSSDGTRLVYTARTGGFAQVYVVDLRTRHARQLTQSRRDKHTPVWSPDGRWIAYSSPDTAGSMQVWRMPAAGGKDEMLTSGAERMFHPAYSPNGRWVYVQPSHRNIYRLPAAGGPLKQVTKFPEAGLFLEEPTLSPDGRWLAYCRRNGGSSLWLLTIGDAPAKFR